MNKVAFIDMEGVLVPEIWKFLAKRLNISELRITTREVEDYEKLMLYRIAVLAKYQITLPKIQSIIGQLDPIEGATEFLQELKRKGFEIKIVSDCFHELLEGFLQQLKVPIDTVYCHRLQVDSEGYVNKVLYSRQHGKHEVIEKYPLSLENSMAIGDAFNDFTMLEAVTHGYLFSPSKEVLEKALPIFNIVTSYQEVIDSINSKISARKFAV
ncbi:bifunctional phosphoserine phosphatase/homoserine phosphotransferase ThrH [Psychrobacter cryohalolentis]|uniref:bifunctional phosphoserine phosphatase/homoserine phosphotransferase ThrH n=1 Tax=Psychrobacter sp. D2 TaxID=2759702 RepID=UPI0015E5D352|nr:bifunctional phosphoserine phosphatase/homoserine phosphotransferase ThrH [Psychrobacter sp. D2]MBA2056318.1 bifunctional phosphoserine phosphatase/homoserine phosphotransferase ThrH [Psychrobacter sp. D2]